MLLKYIFYFLSSTLILALYTLYFIKSFNSTILKIRDFEAIVTILTLVFWINLAVFYHFKVVDYNEGLIFFIISFLPISFLKLFKIN